MFIMPGRGVLLRGLIRCDGMRFLGGTLVEWSGLDLT